MSSTEVPIKFSIYFWTLLWIGCCVPTTKGWDEAHNSRLQDVVGDLWLNGPPPAYAPSHSYHPKTSPCWPSTVSNLRDFGEVGTCISPDQADGVTEIFRSEKISCEFSESSRRYECHMHLTENQIPVYIGLNLTSNGTIQNYTTLNQEGRQNWSRSPVVVLHMVGYPPLDRQNTALFPFSARVICRASEHHNHCHVNEVMLLVVKYSYL